MINIISVTQKGDFSKTIKFLEKTSKANIKSILEKYGKEGINVLSKNTPADSGKTAMSWDYDVKKTKYGYEISWYNTNIVDGVNIAIILQYGHGTRNGGYVSGRDYINPSIGPVFDKMADEAWKEVINK